MPSQLSAWIQDAIETGRPIWRGRRIPSDVIQESHLDAYVARHRILEPGKWSVVRSYVWTIVMRKWGAWLRHESRIPMCQTDIVASAPTRSPSSHLVAQECASIFRCAVLV